MDFLFNWLLKLFSETCQQLDTQTASNAKQLIKSQPESGQRLHLSHVLKEDQFQEGWGYLWKSYVTQASLNSSIGMESHLILDWEELLALPNLWLNS